MSVCKLCKGIGAHKGWCWERGEVKPEPPAPEYRIEKCGGLTVYHPVGSQYPDLQPPKPEPVRLKTLDEMVKRTDLPWAA